MSTIAIIQARMGSTRLPNKVLKDLCGKPVLQHIINRVSKSRYIEKIVVATSIEEEDNKIEKFLKTQHIKCFRGSQNNVLERFYQCAKEYEGKTILRLTSDNALIDPEIIDEGIEFFRNRPEIDYLYYREGLPLGMAVEIFTFDALKRAYKEAIDKECLEHVTPYLYRNKEKFRALRAASIGQDRSYLRWTMDTQEDYQLIQNIYTSLYKEDEIFSYSAVLLEYDKHKEWEHINANICQVNVAYKGEEK